MLFMMYAVFMLFQKSHVTYALELAFDLLDFAQHLVTLLHDLCDFSVYVVEQECFFALCFPLFSLHRALHLLLLLLL